MKKQIVIAGSESFIGKELRRRAAGREFELTGLDVAPAAGSGRHVAVDIRSPDVDAAIPEGADALIHLAAVSRDQDCRRDLAAAFDVNVGGTINLIRAARARGVKQFIFASSEWVYGNAAPGDVQREDTVINANTVASEYALSKLVGERLLAMAQSQGLGAVTVLRFGIVYGPRPKPMSAVEGLFHEVRTLDTVEIKGSLDSGRFFIHVTDIADGILAALGRTGYEIFNLCGDRLITFREVIRESCAILQRQPKVVETNPAALNIRNPDNRKARAQLNWAPRVDLPAGLKTLMAARN